MEKEQFVATADASQLAAAAANPQAQTPAPILGKFKDAAELEKAYVELEKKLGQVPKPAEQPKVETPTPQAVDPKSIPGIEDYSAEFRENGKLSDETYAKIEQATGKSRADVDQYIADQQKLAEAQTYKVEAEKQAVYTEVGGEETYKQLLHYAASLPPEEIAAYNAVMNSGDVNQIKLAARGLKAKFADAFGEQPQLVAGIKSNGVAGYASAHEMAMAMSDPRYDRDPAYRAEVERRTARTIA